MAARITKLEQDLEDIVINLQSVLLLRRRKLITKSSYDSQKKRLTAKRDDIENRIDDIKEEIKKKEVAAAKRAAAELKRAAALAKKVSSRTNVLFQQRVPPPQNEKSLIVVLVAAYQATERVGDMIAITVVQTNIVKDGKVKMVEVAEVFDVENPTGMKLKAFIAQWSKYLYGDKVVKVTLIRPTKIKPKVLQQAFRDGISHCVFTPLINYHTSVISGRACADTKRQSKKCIEKLNEMAKEYDTGVPEDKMEEVAKAARVQVAMYTELDDITQNVFKEYNVANNRKCLHFTNTRENHIDIGHLALNEKGIRVSQEEFDAIMNRWDTEKTWYRIEGNPFKRNRIRSLTQCFYIEDPEKVYFDAMDDLIGLKNIRLNATRFPEVNKFIKQGRIINSWCVSMSDDEPTGQLDMTKAYTQFKECPYYDGFLGMIQQFRSGSFDIFWLRSHIGLYKFNVTFVPERFKVLGLSGTHILPSPEILYMIDNGVEMEITEGVFGSSFDFEFPPEMLENRRYCKWSGRLGMEMKTKDYTFKCSKEWAGHLMAKYGDKCKYYDSQTMEHFETRGVEKVKQWATDDGENYYEIEPIDLPYVISEQRVVEQGICTVKLPNPTIFTAHHILAFITSYTRITMMEKMRHFESTRSNAKICRVVLDGIYYSGVNDNDYKEEIFKEKKIIVVPAEIEKGLGWYNMYKIDEYNFPPVFVCSHTLFTGQGGCGKTYSVMTNKGFNNVLFVSPLHVLGQDVKEKYGNSYTTIHKLLGKAGDDKCAMFKDDKFYPPVIYVDEVTQIPSEWIEEIFDKYPLSLILLGGDIDYDQWYQCRNGTPGNFSKVWLYDREIHTIHIDGDRRSKDDKLKQLKIDIRSEMKRIFVDGDSGENEQMIAWAYNNLPTINLVQAIEMFKEGDHCIAATHRINTALLAGGVCTGWYKSGGHISYTEVEGYEKRGSFTIHSFQGKTVENGKIFISLSDMFEYSMLYTAVSRATQFEQLYFIA
jgi:hypothetical protein